MLKKFELKQKNKELASTGISLGEIHDSQNTRPILMCLIRALLIFIACFCTTHGFCSCFDIPYNQVNIFLFSAFISLFMGFLYLNKLTFYIGYFILLGGFTIELIRYYLYANSGFQAIVNIIRETYSDHFDLEIMRQAEEFYANRYTTITIALYFLLIFLAMLLNVTISRYMNVAETIFVTFLILEIPIYIGILPPAIDIIGLICCYISVALLKAGTHYRIVIGGKHSHEFLRFKWRNKRSYSYQGNARVTFTILAFSLAIAILISFNFSSQSSKVDTPEEQNIFKEKFDEQVKTLVQSGISGLFDRYSSVGGLSSGRLGGVSSISPDFETDLIVKLVPTNEQTVYLREFKGTYYYNNQWLANALVPNADGSYTTKYTSDEIDKFDNLSYNYPVKKALGEKYYEDFNLDNYIKSPNKFSYQTNSRLEVTNIDGATDHYYLPYVSYLFNAYYIGSDDHLTPASVDYGNIHFLHNRSMRMYYTPIELFNYPIPENYPETIGVDFDFKQLTDFNFYEKYADDNVHQFGSIVDSETLKQADYIYNSCLTVPDSLDDYLFNFCRDNNFFDLNVLINKNREYMPKKDYYNDINEYRMSACKAIKQFFLENYPYTLSPGTTPRSEDFVQYFLEYQKRGFCAHFASASVMLLRHLGIPARYVEGYSVPYSLIQSGTPVDEDIDDWYIGEKNENTKVVSVEVSDYYAHAWIEVYFEGYGFVPFEMTPPSFEATPTPTRQGGLAGLLASLMSVNLDLSFSGDTPNPGSDTNIPDIGNIGGNISTINGSSILTPLLVVIVIGIIVVLTYTLVVTLAPIIKLHTSLNNGQYNTYVYTTYEQFVKFIKRKKLTDLQNPLPLEVSEIIESLINSTEANLKAKDALVQKLHNKEIRNIFVFIEKVLYSLTPTEKGECLLLKDDITILKKLIRRCEKT